MNLKKTLIVALAAFGCMATANAQEKTEAVFNPHWYIQAQAGVEETLGEIGFGDLLSGNAQLSVGYQFDKVWGARLSFNGWQSRGGSELSKTYKWKWYHVSPTLDVTFDVTNAIGGYNPNRVVSFGLFAGLGANVAFHNHQAWEQSYAMVSEFNNDEWQASQNDQYLRLLWTDKEGQSRNHAKPFFLGRFGANVDFRLCDRVSLGLEFGTHVLSDKYNSKKAGNTDWYFTGLAGLKINLGKTHKTRTVAEPKQCCCPAEPRVVEKVIERVVEKAPASTNNLQTIEEKAEPLRRDIFFTISSVRIDKPEQHKVDEIAAYLKANPNAKVNITGYADKGTGNATINKRLSVNRANTVAEALKKQYGISADRIITDSKGDTVQPYQEEVKNRVSICICE